MSVLGENTEAGLKELLTANAEDHMRLNAAASYFEKMGDVATAKELKDKANVELGHFNAIFSTLVKYEGINGLVSDMAKEETEQHVSEYTNVANAAKAEGHDDIEAMLCAFSEQEKGIAETLNRVGMKRMISDMAKEETEQHVSEYTNVANAAKAEGHDDIEAMLCAFSEQEKGIAETLKRTRNAF
jgi:rubrerythrin